MTITQAQKSEAALIARLIMLAMNHECCQNLAGPDHSLDDFHRLMTSLVAQEESQYSYRNTLVARTDEGEPTGICVAYRGDRLHALRQAFIDGAREQLQRDHSQMADEAQPGEYYIDSLAVLPDHRHQGVASALLRAMIERARAEGLPAALLVDQGNPKAERLYASLGFQVTGETSWGGHAMRHMLHRAAADK